jgi:hypothetical protein
MNQRVVTAMDAQALTFVQGQSYRINTTVLSAIYPNWNFEDLIYVETEGNAWATGVITYLSDMTGKAEFVTAAAKDMPLADVSQDWQLKSFHLAGIGYQFNLEEVNTALNIVGGALPSRRAIAAREAYRKFMWDTTLAGQAEKGFTGVFNNPSVPATVAPADGTGSVPYWVSSTLVGLKTPAQILRDFNIAVFGTDSATYGAILANVVLMPDVAYNYIAQTPINTMNTETILSFILRTNLYTQQTGKPIRIRGMRELRNAGTVGAGAAKGRLVAYNDSPSLLKLHLPMPHQFLPVHQDGWGNWVIPGIFRTGGVEFMAPQSAYYLDGISDVPA